MGRSTGMEPPTDVAEISGIGRDPDAFEAFYREHLPWVRRFVARRVDDPHTAADPVRASVAQCSSGLVSRAMKEFIMSWAVILPSTASAIGASTPVRRASSSNDLQDLAPSETCRVEA